MGIIHRVHVCIICVGIVVSRTDCHFSKKNRGRKLKIRLCGDVRHPARTAALNGDSDLWLKVVPSKCGRGPPLQYAEHSRSPCADQRVQLQLLVYSSTRCKSCISHRSTVSSIRGMCILLGLSASGRAERKTPISSSSR
ncbi:hypothetical protein NPIL_631151 [Nephila pilipes]|uniref:Secreted protein n=1 Tax=Nephila pilipes TaxID=299642 RepID=A0A8X6TQR8_NEPPI|nr:hypothetical protein NPIL_631151 [Nephila pilipes]